MTHPFFLSFSGKEPEPYSLQTQEKVKEKTHARHNYVADDNLTLASSNLHNQQCAAL